jgi:hypothetical protein
MGNDPSSPNPDDTDPPVFRNYPASLNRLQDNPNDYDIIFADFEHGSDWIQKNGNLLIELIKWVNTEKEANRQAGLCPEDNVVVGASMGGQVARWALATMEKNGIPHETHTYISFDSPQKGAHIPLSIQSFAFLADRAGADDSGLWKRLNNPAARQMIAQHLAAEFDAGNISMEMFKDNPCLVNLLTNLPVTMEFTQTGAIRNAFTAEMAILGYPQDCRNVGISCGAANGVDLGFEAGGLLLDGTVSVPDISCGLGEEFATEATLFAVNGDTSFDRKLIHLCPGIPPQFNCNNFDSFGPNCIFKGALPIEFSGANLPTSTIDIPSVYAHLKVSAIATYPSLDNAPGCKRGDLTTISKIIKENGGEVNLPAKYTCFMPTISLLDINWPIDDDHLSMVIDLDAIPTPFSSVYAPEESLRHIEITPEITDFSLSQMEIGAANANIPLAALNLQNQSFNFGKKRNRVPDTEVGLGGQLAINIVGTTNYMTANDPVADQDEFHVYTGADCASAAKIDVQRYGLLQIGEPAPEVYKNGHLHVTKGSVVHIHTTGTLRISKFSSLIVHEGGTLIIDQDARIILDDSESKIRIEGTLLLNGNFKFGGKGFFEFAKGNELVYGPDLQTFQLVGSNTRFIRIDENVELKIPTDRHIELIQGDIDYAFGSSLNFTGASDATLRFVNFYSKDYHESTGIVPYEGMGNLKFFNCKFRYISQPMSIRGGKGATYASKTDFTLYKFGVEIYNRQYLDFLDCNWDGSGLDDDGNLGGDGISSYGLRSYYNGITRLRRCTLINHFNPEGDELDMNINTLTANAYSAIQVEGGWLLWMQGGMIEKNDYGILNREFQNGGRGLPTNILLQDKATIRNGHSGIVMKGSKFIGLVMMDCGRLLNLTYGIVGEDIRLSIDPSLLIFNDGSKARPNTFVMRKDINDDLTKFIKICYIDYTPPKTIMARMNFWGRIINNAGLVQVVTMPYPKFIKTDIVGAHGNCEKPIASVNVTYIPIDGKQSDECKISELGGSIPDLMTDIPTGINVFNNVKEGFNKGYDNLLAESFEDAKANFTTVASIDETVENTEEYPQAKTFLHAAVSLSEAAEGNFYIPGESRSTRTVEGANVIRPNPTSGFTQIVLPNDRTNATLRIWDTYGKLIQEIEVTGTTKIDVSTWESGFYIVELVGNTQFRAIRYKMLVQQL